MIAALAAVLIAGAGVGGSPAHASPLEDSTMGSAVFTGPTHAHASSIYSSPAAMALAGRGRHFYLGASLRVSSLRITRRHLDPATGELSDGESMRPSTLSPGGMIAFYSSLGDRYHLGLALHTPTFERFAAGLDPARYHTLGGHAVQVLGSMAAAITATDRILFGFGLSLGYSKLEVRFARDTALEAGSGGDQGISSDCGDGMPCGLENDAASQSYNVDVSTNGLGGLFAQKNLGFTGSMAVRPYGDWWLALSYISPPGAISDLDLSGLARVRLAPRQGSATLRGNAEITVRMPQSVVLGVRGPLIADYEVVGTARWQNYSRHDQFDVRMFGGNLEGNNVPEWYPRYRGLSDVWRLEAGAETNDQQSMRVGGRLRLESGAVDSSTVTPLQVDGLNIGVGAGVEARIAQYIVLTASYDLTWYPPVDSTDSAFDPRDQLACVDSGFAFDVCEAAREGRALPTAAGRYSRFQNSFLLSIRWDKL